MSFIITSKEASTYAEHYSSPEMPVMKALADHTHAHVAGAHMLSGHLQGNFLRWISATIQAQNVIELGTYTGYATLALAEGLPANGKVHTIDTDASLQNIRATYWEKANLEHKIVQHVGPALDVIPTLHDITFDLAFIDADKGNYIPYVNTLLSIMPIGSTIIADNTLFHGEVFNENTLSKPAKHMQAFNKHLQTLPNIFYTLLPIRDGITLIRKIK